MGILGNTRWFRRQSRLPRTSTHAAGATTRLSRICRFEQIEHRRLLSAVPIQIGAVYFEDSVGADEAGDLFEITWTGGAPGTQLTSLVIDTDKLGDGRDAIDTFFDTAPGGTGASGAAGMTIVDHSGIDSVDYSVTDGGMKLEMTFVGFDPGERLTFTIDVDEEGLWTTNPVAEGAEFEASHLLPTFEAAHFYSATDSTMFWDAYDSALTASGLNLPPDDYMPPGEIPRNDQTAAAFLSITQEPLPITISGTVFEDIDLDNTLDSGEPRLGGVELTLQVLDGGDYVSSGQTTLTNASGEYRFEDVLPGTYQVVETQPAGYFSIGAIAGSVDGSQRGVVSGPNVISQIELLGGEDSVHNDFSEALPGRLSGNVYHDANNDGNFDGSETGIGGATIRVQYLPSTGPAPAPDIVYTEADGSWSVGGLMPGDYRVEEITPVGYLDGLDAAGTAGGMADNPGDSITGVHLNSGQSGEEYDFGELVPSSISGRVIADANGNGVFDAGDQVLPAVTVQLRDANGVVLDTAQTDAQGRYSFGGLAPGVYGVEEFQPDGYFDGVDVAGTDGGTLLAPDSIIDVSLASGTIATGYDFFEILPSSISGRVIADVNGNGIFDAGDQLLPAVAVQLRDAAGMLLATAETDAQGRYSFDGLAPGVYGVEELQPDGYYDGVDLIGTEGGTLLAPDSIIDISLISGTHAAQYDFLEILPSSISGRVIADVNGNGTFDAGDQLLPGVAVQLRDAAGMLLATAETDAQGRYSFDGLAPSVYGVEELQPDGYYDGVDLIGTEGGTLLAPDSIIDISLISGTHAAQYDFLEILPSSISGRVIVDANGNGAIDAGETPIAGVSVHLVDEWGATIKSAVTDSTGRYAFTGLAPGVYEVEEMQPDGYFDGADLVGSEGGVLVQPDSVSGIALISGTDAAEYNFLELSPMSISGFVYADDDDDGNRDSNEAGISGAKLELLDAGGKKTGITTTTDSTGFYRFDGLEPGETYGVAETQPAGYFDGTDTAGTAGGVANNPGDSITGAVPLAGMAAEEYNFGELRPASISGQVHGELNGDCIPDPGEPLLAGVTIYLLDSSGNRIDSTTTDSNGEYSFRNLEPGVYGVEEIQPDGYLQGKTNVGTAGGELEAADMIVGAQLGPGVNGLDYNFCEAVPASISGYVFQDGPTIEIEEGDDVPDPAMLRDGELTPDDLRLEGVVLTLGDGSGAPVLDANGDEITTVTDETGYYEFTGLERGIYTILETQPDDLIDSIDTAGSNGGIAINPSDEIDLALLDQLAVDPKDDAIIRIPIGMGDAATSYNFSEVRVEEVQEDIPYYPPIPPNDPPMPPVTRPQFEAPLTSKVVYTPSPSVLIPSWGGGGYLLKRTWHLSIINAGQPRHESDGIQSVNSPASIYFDLASWSGSNLDRGEWTIANSGDNPINTFVFGIDGATPLTGDFNGDGVDEVAVFIDGHWFIDLNGNGVWDSGDLWAKLGDFGDLPVTGDWDGDGKADIGIFGVAWSGDPRAIDIDAGLPDVLNQTVGSFKNIPPAQPRDTFDVRVMKKSAQGQTRADVIDHVFQYGSENDIPITGDFNGDGITNIGLYRRGTWYLDIDGDGRWSETDTYIENFGSALDLPVVGDFNGDGIDQLGIYNAGTWRLDSDGNRRLDDTDEVRHLGGIADKPVVGDFDGDGIDEIAVYRSIQTEGDAQAAIVTRAPQ